MKMQNYKPQQIRTTHQTALAIQLVFHTKTFCHLSLNSTDINQIPAIIHKSTYNRTLILAMVVLNDSYLCKITSHPYM